MVPPSDTGLPVVASGSAHPGVIARIGQVAFTGMVVTAWMGLVEALVVWSMRHVPEPAPFLRTAILGYAALGLVVGACWGALVEIVSRRRGRWRRRPFYVVSLFLLILLFQVVLHTHTHWTDFTLTPGSLKSLKVTALETLPAGLVIVGAWFVCVRRKSPEGSRRLLGLRAAVVLVAPLAVVAALPWARPLVPSPRRGGMPNVLFIVLDTTRADRLSAYGYGRPTTPHLERITADGLTFRRAYAASPWTLPSHASMFTGEYAGIHNATWEHQYLDDRLPTLAEHLSGLGLRTAAFSKHVWLSDETGLMRGFEQFYDLYWRSTTALVALSRFVSDELRTRKGIEDKGAALVTARFKKWIDGYGDEPFFAFINYLEPHAHYQPPAPFRERFLADGRKDTFWGRDRQVSVQKFNAGVMEYSDEDMAAFSDLYDGAVAYQDSMMGEALDHLRDRDLLDRTLLIITADHGENLGEHDLLGHEFCVYNTLLHVPLIVRLPGVVPAGMTFETPVENRLVWSMIDLILGSGDEARPLPADQLAAVLREPDDAGGPILSELYIRPLTSEMWLNSPRLSEYDRRLRCVQINDGKYIWSSDGGNELYDLAVDPGELINLAGLHLEDAGVLRDLLLAKAAALGAGPGGETPEFSEELKRRLKSLGYLD